MSAMAAWCAMSLLRGLLAAFMVAMAVAGCSVLMRGHGVMGGPKPGTAAEWEVKPVQWSACTVSSAGESAVPPNAQCGMLTVPVDYTKPDGDVAQLALLRFPANGIKIGSL